MLHQHRGKISTASLPDLFSELTVKTSSNEIIDINQIEWTGATSGKITCSHDNGDKNSMKETDDDHIIKLLATTNHLSKIVIDERCVNFTLFSILQKFVAYPLPSIFISNHFK